MASSNVSFPPPLQRLNPLFPGQLFVPGAATETGLRLDTNGTIFWVDPNAVGVSDQRDGTDPTEPLATVAAALLKCSAYSNDVIVVAPSNTWKYDNATLGRITPIQEEVTVNVPGVRIVGLAPSHSLGVPWYPTQIGGRMITVQAMNVLIEGFCFMSAGLLTNPIAIRALWDAPPYGENLTVRHCYFDNTLDYGIQMDYAWNCHIHDNHFFGNAVAAIFNMNVEGDPDQAVIHDNLFVNCAAAIKLLDVDYCSIYRNLIWGNPAGTNNFIDLTGGTNNLVADNWLGCTIAAAQYATTCTSGAGDAWINNHLMDGDAVTNP